MCCLLQWQSSSAANELPSACTRECICNVGVRDDKDMHMLLPICTDCTRGDAAQYGCLQQQTSSSIQRDHALVVFYTVTVRLYTTLYSHMLNITCLFWLFDCARRWWLWLASGPVCHLSYNRSKLINILCGTDGYCEHADSARAFFLCLVRTSCHKNRVQAVRTPHIECIALWICFEHEIIRIKIPHVTLSIANFFKRFY